MGLLFCADQWKEEHGKHQLLLEGVLALVFVLSLLVIGLAAGGHQVPIGVASAITLLMTVYGFWTTYMLKSQHLIIFSGAMLLPVVLLFMGTLFSIFYMAAPYTRDNTMIDNALENTRIATITFSAFNVAFGLVAVLLAVTLHFKVRPPPARNEISGLAH